MIKNLDKEWIAYDKLFKEYLESRTKQQIRSMKRFGMELHSIFGEKKAKRISGKMMYLYQVVQIQNLQGNGDGRSAASTGEYVYEKEDNLPF